ncbi:hypothetical protein IFU05_09705 [Pseudomonas syringae]|nr:hypothetical protein [Pseudomonas syringae]
MAPATAGAARAWLALATALVLIGLGGGVGVWLAAGHYRPLLDTAGTELATCRSTSNNLFALMEEQGRQVRELEQQAAQRQAKAEQAVELAKVDAQADYAAANRIQQERTGGDQCQAATSVIDQELGL